MPRPKFQPGCKGGPGRPKKNPIERQAAILIHRYARQKADSFKEACEKLLPLGVDRVQELLQAKGIKNGALHLRAVEMLGDRVYGRPAQALTAGNGSPLLVAFVQVLGGVDGARTEKLVGPAEAVIEANGGLMDPPGSNGNGSNGGH